MSVYRTIGPTLVLSSDNNFTCYLHYLIDRGDIYSGIMGKGCLKGEESI